MTREDVKLRIMCATIEAYRLAFQVYEDPVADELKRLAEQLDAIAQEIENHEN